MKDLGKHALWIYGAFVSLCIREAVTAYFAHAPATPTNPYQEILELCRLGLFLFVIARFFLGAAHFFEDVHGGSAESAAKYPEPQKNFEMDFLIGMLHFIFFYIWSLTITDHTSNVLGFTKYFGMMTLVLLYDLVWFAVSTNYVTRNPIAMWAALNTFTMVVAIFLFGAVRIGYFFNDRALTTVASISSELASFIPIAIVGLFDIKGLLKGKSALPHWMRHLVEAFERPESEKAASG